MAPGRALNILSDLPALRGRLTDRARVSEEPQGGQEPPPELLPGRLDLDDVVHFVTSEDCVATIITGASLSG